MKIDEILTRFGEHDECDDGGYLAHCPAHVDSRPSLRIWLGDDRKLRLTCRAGCSTGAVIAAVDLRWPDLFDVSGDAPMVPKERPALVGIAQTARLAAWLDSRSGITMDAAKYLTRRFGLDADQAGALGLGTTPANPTIVDDNFPGFVSRAWLRFPRLVVPLRDFSGVPRGAQGRDLSGQCPARWLSLRNPEGQRWSPYGVLRCGDDSAPWIVTEGPGDGLTAVAAGFNAVVIRGAALANNDDVVKEIADGLQGRVVVAAGDADAAGQRFNAAVADGLRAAGVAVHALELPSGAADITAWREANPEGFAVAFSEAIRCATQASHEGQAASGATPGAGPVQVQRSADDTAGVHDGNAAETTGAAPMSEPAAKVFDRAYWDEQRAALDNIGADIMHANYAQFVADHCGGNLRYVRGAGWYCWNGKHWETAADDSSSYQAITDAKAELAAYAVSSGADWALRAANNMLIHRHRAAIVKELGALRDLRCEADDMDAATHLLNFQNGTVDLRTGELREHSPADMLTHCARVNYEPSALAPRWLGFVEDVFPGDSELQRYFQTFLGYSITGEVREHALGVWYGAHGRNGKGTTIRTLESIFGASLVRDVPFEMFERSRSETHVSMVAQLRDARIVVAQEGNAETPMNTARLKNFTGGDRINTRQLYQRETLSFMPRFTLVLATNHLPEFASGGAALWARTKAVHFAQSFAGREDRTLEPALQGPEREGIAAWLVEGAKRYYAEGLRDADAVRDATNMHREAVDPLKELTGEIFEYDEGAKVKRSEFNIRLKEWRDVNGDRAAKFSPSGVKRNLLARGVTEVKTREGWWYEGIRFLEDMPSAEAAARDQAVADGSLRLDIFNQGRPA